MLNKPDSDDVRKLHAEINQIVNQRFILTTLTITVFGVLSALMVHNGGSAEETKQSPFIAAILLSILLLVICMWSHLLKNTLRIFTTYLVETGKSGWEHDWGQFRSAGPYFAYTKLQALIFLFLNPLGFLFALTTAGTQAWEITLGGGMFAAVVLVVTELLMFLITFPDRSLKGFFLTEEEIKRRWKQLNGQR